mgnify:FL=1
MAEEFAKNCASGLGKTGKKHGGVIAIATALVLCAVIGAFFGKQYYDACQHRKAVSSVLDTDLFYSGISVEGVHLGGMTYQQAQQAVKAKEQDARGTYCVKVTYGGKVWKWTQDDMEFTYDTDKVLKEAYSYGRSGDREQRYQQVCALKTNPKNYSISSVLKEESLKAKVEEAAAGVSRDPVEPSVVSFDASTQKFTCKDGVSGVSVDTSALWSDVKAIVEGTREGSAEMQAKTVPFSMTLSQLKSRLKKLGTYSTTSKNNSSGTYNMSRALAAVSGHCVPSGGTFSFLGTVGPCDKAHGYLPAGALVNGRHVQQYGGGACQASTTIYGAALRSGMEITERSNHRIPSSYCPIGQDATISYPYLDMKFRNPSKYPVYILTHTKGRVLTAEFYGYLPPDYDEIQVSSRITQTIPAPEKAEYTEDNSLGVGVVCRTAKAHLGYRASAQRTYYKNGRAVKTEALPSSYYRPVSAQYSYGKGTDLSKLQNSAAGSQKPAA